MRLVLKRFSQDVELLDPDTVQYFLVFEKDSGEEVRLPVPKETTEALVKLLYGEETNKEAEAEVSESYEEELREEDFQDATEFGSDQDEEFPDGPQESDGPASEDEVPSL